MVQKMLPIARARLVVRLIAAGAYAAVKGQDYPAHKHPDWELICYRTGYIYCDVSGEIVVTQPGMVLLIPSNTVHHDRALTSYSQFYLQLDVSGLPDWERVYFDDETRKLTGLFRNLVWEWGSQETNRSKMLQLLLEQLNILLERSHNRPHPSSAEQLVRTVEHLLEERFATSPKIKEIAEAAHASPSTIRNHFAQLRDYSPRTYLQRVRLARAMELVRGSDLNLEDVAILCGYHSASHLSWHIKKATGKSPGTFRTGDL